MYLCYFKELLYKKRKPSIELAKSRDEYEKRKASAFEIKQKPIKSYSLSDILHEKPMGNEEIEQVVFKKILFGQAGKKTPGAAESSKTKRAKEEVVKKRNWEMILKTAN